MAHIQVPRHVETVDVVCCKFSTRHPTFTTNFKKTVRYLSCHLPDIKSEYLCLFSCSHTRHIEHLPTVRYIFVSGNKYFYLRNMPNLYSLYVDRRSLIYNNSLHLGSNMPNLHTICTGYIRETGTIKNLHCSMFPTKLSCDYVYINSAMDFYFHDVYVELWKKRFFWSRSVSIQLESRQHRRARRVARQWRRFTIERALHPLIIHVMARIISSYL